MSGLRTLLVRELKTLLLFLAVFGLMGFVAASLAVVYLTFLAVQALPAIIEGLATVADGLATAANQQAQALNLIFICVGWVVTEFLRLFLWWCM